MPLDYKSITRQTKQFHCNFPWRLLLPPNVLSEPEMSLLVIRILVVRLLREQAWNKGLWLLQRLGTLSSRKNCQNQSAPVEIYFTPSRAPSCLLLLWVTLFPLYLLCLGGNLVVQCLQEWGNSCSLHHLQCYFYLHRLHWFWFQGGWRIYYVWMPTMFLEREQKGNLCLSDSSLHILSIILKSNLAILL